MKPIEIKHAIECAGSSQTQIAERLGVSKMAVNLVIWKGMISKSIHSEIARTIGRDVAEVWPDYYRKKAVNQ